MRRLLYVLSAGTAMTALSLLVWMTSGCSTGNAPIPNQGGSGLSGSSAATLASGGASTIYVLQQNSVNSSGTLTGQPDTVLGYTVSAGTATGSPSSTQTLPSGFVTYSLATDAAGDVYVGGQLNGAAQILEYSASHALISTITPLNNVFTNPYSMYVDASGNLYVADATPEIVVYPANATGAATPSRVITGSATTITNLYGIAADGSGDVYVTSVPTSGTGGSILEFAANANGNAAPVKTITGTGVESFYGVAVDASGNIYATADDGTASSNGEIVEFASTATTNAPILTITSGVQFGEGIRRDSAGNLFAVQQNLSSGTPSIIAFGPSATGNSTPGLTLTSTAFTAPSGEIALH